MSKQGLTTSQMDAMEHVKRFGPIPFDGFRHRAVIRSLIKKGLLILGEDGKVSVAQPKETPKAMTPTKDKNALQHRSCASAILAIDQARYDRFRTKHDAYCACLE